MLTAVSFINEFCQKNGASVDYTDTGRYGQDHCPTFTVRCTVNCYKGDFEAEASAPSKKAAKTMAAEKVVDLLNGKAMAA